jgi:hypothetical protein
MSLQISGCQLVNLITDACKARNAVDFSQGQPIIVEQWPPVVTTIQLSTSPFDATYQTRSKQAEQIRQFVQQSHLVRTWAGDNAPAIISGLEFARAIRTAIDSIKSLETSPTIGDGPMIQIRGLYIQGDVDLEAFKFPGSIKLICCYLEGYLLLNQGSVLTLDLSGCTLHGLSANFLRCQGSLRARRTSVLGMIDIGGCEVHGATDISDSVIMPVFGPPSTVPAVGERGVLNLSMAHFKSEVRIIRTRVYGGVLLSNATFDENIRLTESLFLSPVAVFVGLGCNGTLSQIDSQPCAKDKVQELIGKRLLQRKAAITSRNDSGNWSNQEKITELEYLKSIVDKDAQYDQKYCSVILKKMEDKTNGSSPTLFEVILSSYERRRNHAILGTKISLAGSIKAQFCFALGNVDLRFGQFGANVDFQGATLISHSYLATYQSQDVRNATNNVAEKHKKLIESLSDQKWRVIDLSYCRQIGGKVIFGVERDNFESSRDSVPGKRLFEDGQIMGQIHLDNTKVSGSVLISYVEFCDEVEHFGLTQADVSSEDLMNMADVSVRSAQIVGDLKLDGSKNITSMSADECKVGGSVNFSAAPKFNRMDDRFEPLVGMVTNAMGVFSFRRAKIDGSLVLPFDRINGPTLYLEGSKVGGTLSILPMERETKVFTKRVGNGAIVIADNSTTRAFPLLTNGQTNAHSIETEDTGELIVAIVNERKLIEQDRSQWLHDETVTQNQWSRLPQIRLSMVTTTYLEHPPTAWPVCGGLNVRGLKYSDASMAGPLYPLRRTVSNNKNFSKFSAIQSIFWFSLLFVFLVELSLIFLRLVRFLITRDPQENANFLNLVFAYFGVFNVAASMLCVCAIGAFVLARRSSWPAQILSKPMAIPWLSLQLRSPHTYRAKAFLQPLGSYLLAARIMRTAGRRLSSELVERERLIQRTKNMGGMRNIHYKFFYRVLQLISEYGFSPARVISLLAAVFLAQSMAIHQIRTCGGIEPVKLSGEFATGQYFSPTQFSLDLMIPILGSSHASKWRITGRVWPSPINQENRDAYAVEYRERIGQARGIDQAARVSKISNTEISAVADDWVNARIAAQPEYCLAGKIGFLPDKPAEYVVFIQRWGLDVFFRLITAGLLFVTAVSVLTRFETIFTKADDA